MARAVADKGYDAAANRKAARERGICPVIHHRSNTGLKYQIRSTSVRAYNRVPEGAQATQRKAEKEIYARSSA
jgi:IS5 family transposase